MNPFKLFSGKMHIKSAKILYTKTLIVLKCNALGVASTIFVHENNNH